MSLTAIFKYDKRLTMVEDLITKKNGLPIQKIFQPTPKINIHVDASNTGWGISSPMVQTSEFWTDKEV